MGRKKESRAADVKLHAGDQQPRELLTESETQFFLALENNSDIITVFKRDGRITYQSTAIGRILGVDPESRIGANIFTSELVHPDDRATIRGFVKKLINSKPGQELKGGFRLRHVDGTFRDIEAIGINMLHDPNLRGVILSSRDVTERKAALDALAASEARYALTINNAPIGIAHCEPEDGWFILANKYFCETLGYSQKEMLRKRFRDITNAEDLRLNLVAVDKIQQGNLSDYYHEQLCYRKDGSTLWVNLRMTVQRDTDRNVDYFLITIEDISERKRAEEAMKAQHKLQARAAILAKEREQLIAVNKAKDEFVSLASHQLRTPATGVKQYLGMLLQGYLGTFNQEQQSFLTKAYESNERQLKIINQLLYVARLDAGTVQLELNKCNLSKLLEDIVEEQRISFKERGQKVVLDMPAKPVTALVDERLLRMAIENLLDNAGKYSPAGKKITLSLQKDKKQVEIAVHDRGVGIPKKQQAQLFQKFSRLDNSQSLGISGTGLGLYWAKKIIDLHHGILEVASKSHRGSTFIITLFQPSAKQNKPEERR